MGEWLPTRIRWVDLPLESSTGATRAETDLGPAYVKFLGNPEGAQALFCEHVGTRAASWLGLPTFETSTIDVTEPRLVQYANGTCSEPGPAFATRYVQGTAWGGSAEELASIENPDALAGLIVLDTWIANCDRFRAEPRRRQPRNVYLRAGSTKGKLAVMAMDHTHCLVCGRELTKAIAGIERAQEARLYGHFPEFQDFIQHGDVRRFAQRLGSFKTTDADAIIATVPAAWRPTDDTCRAVASFLAQRASFVSENICRMLIEERYIDAELELER